jgi:hypothetical protein
VQTPEAMSFKPIVTLQAVARDNSTFTIVDATPTDTNTGWGSPNAPAAPASITSLFSSVQPYGGTPVNSTTYTGSVATSITFVNQISDGVNNYNVYYGLSKAFTNLTLSQDKMSIQSTDPNLANLLDGVSAISADGQAFPVQILSIQNGVINLAAPLTTGLTGNSLFCYYIATVQALTINNGEAICVNAISLLPLEVDSCDNAKAVFNNVALKLSAQIAFGCGNISKAHEAALLLSGSKPPVTTNCSTCG